MSKEPGFIENAAAHLVASLPQPISKHFNLSGGAAGAWYRQNNHFKFDVGDTLKSADTLTHGEGKSGWTVEGHTTKIGSDAYLLKDSDGNSFTDFKANVESYFQKEKTKALAANRARHTKTSL